MDNLIERVLSIHYHGDGRNRKIKNVINKGKDAGEGCVGLENKGVGLGSRMEVRAGWRDLKTHLQYKFLHAIYIMHGLHLYKGIVYHTVEYGLNYAVGVFFLSNTC